MSTKPNAKVVKIKENDLVNLIDKIVAETVSAKKKEWLSEQTIKSEKTLEETVAQIVKKQLGK
jgi:hypothetical protein